MNDQPWWHDFASPRFAVSFVMVAVAAYCTHIVLTGDFSPDLKGGVIAAWVITGVQEIRKFWLNSTNDSEKKSDTINTLVKTSKESKDLTEGDTKP